MRIKLVAFILFLGVWCMRSMASEAAVGFIEIEGAIGPTTSDYISRSLNVSSEKGYECLIIKLDTPGGLLDSTKDIVKTFFESEVPTVVYVAPSGASAGSAGCFITLAADVAAMAPNTTIGAAHPVAGTGQEMGDVMKEKVENYAISFIESIAEKRNRNVEWAKSSVKESASITAEKAMELGVIEIVAADIEELLERISEIEVGEGRLEVAGAEVVNIPMTIGERIFQTIWRPEVMYVLMLVAIYGIIGELSNPGSIIPGVVGVIALIISLYMASVLSVNIAGVALIILGVLLFISEAFTPSFGVLTVGGAVSFFLGSLMLFDSSVPSFSLSLSYIIPAVIVTAVFFILVIGTGLKAQLRPSVTGKESMKGKLVKTVGKVDSSGGRVLFEGEYWNARSDIPIQEGEWVEIADVNGLEITVKPKKKES
ncbi:MAG: nodulation protein NfeD [Verrucomicrobia bacterium]|nr:nodulation protein NfeD [Verrucomicrobiota bacterium]MCF7707701.1 nodulation protein NfeD [Verrucomicrobiota bacterium]